MSDIWREIPLYNGRYKINTNGDIVSCARISVDSRGPNRGRTQKIKEKTLRSFDNSTGYKQVNLIDGNGVEKKKYVHRLVALTFLPNPNNLTDVNHKDGDKSNNRVSNLEWVTHAENVRHSIEKLGNKPKGPKAKKVMNTITGEIFTSVKEVSKKYEAPTSSIYAQISGRVASVRGQRFAFADQL